MRAYLVEKDVEKEVGKKSKLLFIATLEASFISSL